MYLETIDAFDVIPTAVEEAEAARMDLQEQVNRKSSTWDLKTEFATKMIIIRIIDYATHYATVQLLFVLAQAKRRQGNRAR